MPTGTIFGSSIGGKGGSLTLSAENARFGTLPVVRQFFPGMPGSIPSGLTTAMLYMPSFKCNATDYTGLVANTYTSALQTWLRSLPAGQPTLACYYHEPEDNCQPEAKTGFTLAQWRAAADKWNDIVHTTSGIVANVQAIQIFMEYTLQGGKGRNINNYYPTNHLPDIVGFDFDGFTGYPDLSSTIATAQAFAASKGIPWCVPEFGASPAASDSTHAARTAFNNKVAGQFAAAGATAVAYWDDGSVELTTSNEITAWAALVAASPPTTPAVPTGITCTPAAAGTTAVIGWAALPGGVDHVDAYLQGPGQTYPHKLNTSGPIPVSPRTYSFPTVPGTTYSPGVTLVAVDAAGNRSGFGAFVAVPAPNPGPTSQSPIITSALPTQDGTNPLLYHCASAATSPASRTLTYLWTFTYPGDPTVGAVTLTTASGDVTLTAPGAWNWSLVVTDTSALKSSPQTGSVGTPLTNSVTTPFLGARMLQHTEDPRQMAIIEQQSKPLFDAAIQGLFNRQTSWNAKYELAGSNFSPDSISPTVTAAMASGTLIWWAFPLEAISLTELLFATSVPQNGSGAVVGVHDSSGLLLPDFQGVPASGTAVDAGLVNGGVAAYGIAVPLGLIVQKNLTWGETLIGQAFFPAGMTTYPTFRCSGVNGAAAILGVGSATPLWGIITGQSAYANNLAAVSGPFSLWSAQNQIWGGAQ